MEVYLVLDSVKDTVMRDLEKVINYLKRFTDQHEVGQVINI